MLFNDHEYSITILSCIIGSIDLHMIRQLAGITIFIMKSTMATGFTGIRALFVLVSACLSASGKAVGSGSGVKCIGSLDFIRSFEELVEDESVLRTYVLCPNEFYELAEVLHEGMAFSEGQSPLLISKSNVQIQCGEDGSSSNNCVLVSALSSSSRRTAILVLAW